MIFECLQDSKNRHEDQGTSESCTWQAFSYYFWQWTGIQLSRQDGYSRTHLPQGGGYLVDPFKVSSKDGCYTRDEHQDPNPQTEKNMTQKVYLQIGRRIFKVTFWRPPQQDIDGIAWAIKNYKGCVGGVYGRNADWGNLLFPEPPPYGYPSEWAHALYFYDNWVVGNQKALKAKSSWCNSAKNHFIKDNYFVTGNTFSFWVMEVKETTMNEFVETINNKGKVGIVVYADTADHLQFLGKMYNKEIIIKPDGGIETDITI